MKGFKFFLLLTILILGILPATEAGVTITDDEFVFIQAQKLDTDADPKFEVYRVEIRLHTYTAIQYQIQLNMFNDTFGAFIMSNVSTYDILTDTADNMLTVEFSGPKMYESGFNNLHDARFQILVVRIHENDTVFEYDPYTYTETIDYTEFQMPDALFVEGSEKITFYDQDTLANVTDCFGCVDELTIEFDVNIITPASYRFFSYFELSGIGRVENVGARIEITTPGTYTFSNTFDVTGMTTDITESVLFTITGEIFDDSIISTSYYHMKNYAFEQDLNTSLFEGDAFSYEYYGFDYVEEAGAVIALQFDFQFKVGKPISIDYNLMLSMTVNGSSFTSRTKSIVKELGVGYYNVSANIDVRVLYGNNYDTAFSMGFYAVYDTGLETFGIADPLYHFTFNDSRSIAKPDVYASSMTLTPMYNDPAVTTSGYDYAKVDISFDITEEGVFDLDYTFSGISTFHTELTRQNVTVGTLDFSFNVPGAEIAASSFVGDFKLTLVSRLSTYDLSHRNESYQLFYDDIDYSEYNPIGYYIAPEPTPSDDITTSDDTTTAPDTFTDEEDTLAGIPLPSSVYFFFSVLAIVIIRRKDN